MPKNELLTSARHLLSPIETELARMAKFKDPMQAYYYCACSVN